MKGFMRILLVFLSVAGFICFSSAENDRHEPPSLYEYFLSDSVDNSTGLVAVKDGFFLNGKEIRIISGAIHYFRVHPDYWRDRLRKLRASGANTVETYVAWNLHEPIKGQFDFGQGGNDMSLFLDLRRFIEIAKEEDLLLILRPGPYICSEFEFGGMPSWLLRDPNMAVRTAYIPYLERVKIYLDNLLPQVVDLQFTNGGPIIALQIENEYASFDHIDLFYIALIKEIYILNEIDSFLFTSDGPWHGPKGGLPDVFKTINFQDSPETNIEDLLKFQPDLPVFVMEFWAGWFDHWFEGHSFTNVDSFGEVLEVILGPYNGSVNFYMWHGGTNFGFNAGANFEGNKPILSTYAPDVTSYDYDAPLSEAGDYTAKYSKIREMVDKYQIPELSRPSPPTESLKVAYAPIPLQTYLSYSDILGKIPSTSKFQMTTPVSMELLPMNLDCGQSQGYAIYRKQANVTSGDVFKAGPVRDFGIFLVSGDIQEFPKDVNVTTEYWLNSVQEYEIRENGVVNLDLMIENMGRVNFGDHFNFVQHKGLVGKPEESYHLNGEEIQGVEIIALEFKSAWVKNLTDWREVNPDEELKAPLVIQSTFGIDGIPSDTFLNMEEWTKGIVFVNGFNLGRYWNVGPQQTLYCPGPFLKSGINTITIFEQLKPGSEINFSSAPNLGPPIPHSGSSN